jgi:AcrR family transcriptional regulator
MIVAGSTIRGVASRPSEGTRRYDSPVRRERSAETRERIIEAGSELVHDLSSWDWRSVTVREVARRAGVHERTVHRHFATEHDLRAALLQRLIEESGVTVEGMTLDELPGHVKQLFDYLASFSSSGVGKPDPALHALDERRKAATLETVSNEGRRLSEADQRLAAAMLDALWSVATYQRLISGWDLDPAEAVRGVGWLIELLSEAIKQGRPPST